MLIRTSAALVEFSANSKKIMNTFCCFSDVVYLDILNVFNVCVVFVPGGEVLHIVELC